MRFWIFLDEARNRSFGAWILPVLWAVLGLWTLSWIFITGDPWLVKLLYGTLGTAYLFLSVNTWKREGRR